MTHTWHHIIHPEKETLIAKFKELHLSETLQEIDFINETISPEAYTKYLTAEANSKTQHFFAFYFPFAKKQKDKTIFENEEIDFIMKDKNAICTHMRENKVLETFFSDKAEDNNAEKKVSLSDILLELYKSVELSVGGEIENIKKIEKHLFDDGEIEIIEKLSNAKKNMLDIYSSLKMHYSVLKSSTLINQKVHTQYLKIMHLLETQKEVLEDMKSTTDFLLTQRTNEIIKKFTIVSFLILPLSFIASFFGMNTKFPSDLVNSTYGTVYIMIIMLVFCVVSILYFRHKKWL